MYPCVYARVNDVVTYDGFKKKKNANRCLDQFSRSDHIFFGFNRFE